MRQTLNEAQRDGRTHPRCGRCGIIWRQSGNRTGHCSGCHRTFDSLEAFDKHQVIPETGRVVCRDPAEVKRGDGSPVFESRIRDGVTYWGIPMSDAWRATLAGMRPSAGDAVALEGLPGAG